MRQPIRSVTPVVLACAVLALVGLVPAVPLRAADPPAAKKKAAPRPTLQGLQRLIDEQRVLIEEQQRLIDEQRAKIEQQGATIGVQESAIAAQQARLDDLQRQLAELSQRLEDLQARVPGAEEQAALEERIRKAEEQTNKVPELPPNVVSAGDFPGSIRIPGTDAAVKFGGRVRTAAVFTLAPLGSDDRFVTHSIPVESTDTAVGQGRRTTFTANTSRFNFEMRTPTGVGHMRTFLEGDFFGSDVNDNRVAFRLRHAYAQFRGFIVGQTWSTFSDPAARHEDLDFEGINGENVIRQPQIRYTWLGPNDRQVAVAAETPEVSLTGGEGVNLVPDLVGRVIWKHHETGHLQVAVVLREIRGEATLQPGVVRSAFAWGASVSGVFPFRRFQLEDRILFQLNGGEGNARYINDLNSLGGQDAVFDPITGELDALPAVGGYLAWEHAWKEWKRTREMKLRSTVIWSSVSVHNLSFQVADAYHKTERLSVNLVFSPIDRVDFGLEYIVGRRENLDGQRGDADQVQVVGVFRF